MQWIRSHLARNFDHLNQHLCKSWLLTLGMRTLSWGTSLTSPVGPSTWWWGLEKMLSCLVRWSSDTIDCCLNNNFRLWMLISLWGSGVRTEWWCSRVIYGYQRIIDSTWQVKEYYSVFQWVTYKYNWMLNEIKK